MIYEEADDGGQQRERVKGKEMMRLWRWRIKRGWVEIKEKRRLKGLKLTWWWRFKNNRGDAMSRFFKERERLSANIPLLL